MLISSNELRVLGEALHKCRLNLRWSQQKLADLVKVAKSTVSNWENGKFIPDTQRLIILLKIFKENLGDSDVFKELVKVISEYYSTGIFKYVYDENIENIYNETGLKIDPCDETIENTHVDKENKLLYLEIYRTDVEDLVRIYDTDSKESFFIIPLIWVSEYINENTDYGDFYCLQINNQLSKTGFRKKDKLIMKKIDLDEFKPGLVYLFYKKYNNNGELEYWSYELGKIICEDNEYKAYSITDDKLVESNVDLNSIYGLVLKLIRDEIS